MELFESGADNTGEPLASRMRPRNLDEFAGQEHIVGPGRLLRRAIQADQLSSIILYGPPGTGKTTLARVIANSTQSRFVTLNAVLSGVKDIRKEIAEAKEKKSLYGTRTILFVDEVHRWNKAQQDALLPWVENGTFVLIGATTENPFFEVNAALVSRSRIFQLTELTEDDLHTVSRCALNDSERGYGKFAVEFEDGALEHLVKVADGDARSLLNALQLAVETTPESWPPPEGSRIHIDMAAAEESIQKKVVLYDKEGDYHFDTISAFIKSLRGSDPDAALYWMARMVRGGEDPKYIFRRMLILAAEDIGLADPQALVVTQSAAAAFDRIGLPEGSFLLTQAALYLATCEKSNSSLAFFDAMACIEQEKRGEVPGHLKDGNRDKESFGHGAGYIYPHAFREHWAAQEYLPGTLKGRVFYRPTSRGYEGSIQEKVLARRETQLASMIFGEGDDLARPPGEGAAAEWTRRLSGMESDQARQKRELLFSVVTIGKNNRVLVPRDRSGLYTWEARRKVPGGEVIVIATDPRTASFIQSYSELLPEVERPGIRTSGLLDSVGGSFSAHPFDIILGDDPVSVEPDKAAFFEQCRDVLTGTGELCFFQKIHSESTPLSRMLPEGSVAEVYMDALRAAEAVMMEKDLAAPAGWDGEDLRRIVEGAGFRLVVFDGYTFGGSRVLDEETLRGMLDGGRAGKHYGPLIMAEHSAGFLEALTDDVARKAAGISAEYSYPAVLVHAKR